MMSASLIGPDEVKRFQAIHHNSVEVAREHTLLFGIGTRPFHHGIRGRGGTIFGATLPDGRSKRTCELTSSIVPRGTSFHRLVELGFPGTIFGATLPDGRSKRTCELTSSIVPRGTSFHRLVE